MMVFLQLCQQPRLRGPEGTPFGSQHRSDGTSRNREKLLNIAALILGRAAEGPSPPSPLTPPPLNQGCEIVDSLAQPRLRGPPFTRCPQFPEQVCSQAMWPLMGTWDKAGLEDVDLLPADTTPTTFSKRENRRFAFDR